MPALKDNNDQHRRLPSAGAARRQEAGALAGRGGRPGLRLQHRRSLPAAGACSFDLGMSCADSAAHPSQAPSELAVSWDSMGWTQGMSSLQCVCSWHLLHMVEGFEQLLLLNVLHMS